MRVATRIARIRVFQAQLTLHEGSYKWANGKSVEAFDSTVVFMETEGGLTGAGENCPLGSNYLPAFAGGSRAAIAEMAPHLIGLDACNLHLVNSVMDRTLKGHPYAKSAIDMACWDILGKRANMPVCDLMGGRQGGPYDLYRAISQRSAEDMAANISKYLAEGYRKFQLKVGGDVQDDIDRIRACRDVLDRKTAELQKAGHPRIHMPLFCDANTGWLQGDALRVVNGVKDLDVYIEQPCLTYDECLHVRNKCPLPMIIDEAMDDVRVLLNIIRDNAADAINLKISKVGGLTKARVIRDLAVECGIKMNIEDTWGGDVITSAIAHLAHSTNSAHLLCSTDFNSYGPVSIARTDAIRNGGKMQAPTQPGLGVELNFDVLGKCLIDVQ